MAVTGRGDFPLLSAWLRASRSRRGGRFQVLYKSPPHGGYGFGFTRMLMIMLGLKNVREVTYVYRGVNRLAP
jgi:hypothetical protein